MQYFHVRICGACGSVGLIALVVVGHTSSHSLGELKDTSGGHECWERRLLISQEQMKAGSATEFSQPLLFAAGPPGCLCIFGGKVSIADLFVGIDVGILHHTNERQLQREAQNQASKRKIYVFTHCNTLALQHKTTYTTRNTSVLPPDSDKILAFHLPHRNTYQDR